jgi:hypothetical protein
MPPMPQSLPKRLFDRIVVNLIARVVRKTYDPSVVGELQRRAVRSSADYAEKHMSDCVAFSDNEDFVRFAFSKRPAEGLIAEFGVFKGESIRWLGAWTDQPVYGFDSFEGLEEDWTGTTNHAKGTFDVGGRLPTVPANVTLIKGWFDKTLPGFLAQHPGPFSFLHLDADTYEATKTVLDLCADRIVPGTIIAFDEYFGFRGWEHGEWKAWQEFGRPYKYISFSRFPVAVVVTG